MQRLNRPHVSRRDIAFGCIVLLVILTDQLSKWWITKWWETANPPDGILWNAGFLQIVHVFNTGAAFGVFKGHSPTLLVVDVIGILVMLYALFSLRRRWPFLDSMAVKTGVGLIIGGTVGNLIDRIRFGGVTDFIDFKVWPVFNVADSCVTIGVIILAVYIVFVASRTKKQA